MISLNQSFFDREDFARGNEISMRKGAYLLMEGDQATQGVYLLLEGEVDIFIEGLDGQQILLFKLGKGHILGEMGILGNTHRMSFVRCLTSCRLLHVSRDVWDHNMKSEAFIRKLLNSIIARYTETQHVVNRLGQSKVTLRLGAWILDQQAWQLDEKPEYIDIKLPTHANLARMVNCTRERMTRIINDLIKSGIFEIIDKEKTVRIYHDKLMDNLQGH